MVLLVLAVIWGALLISWLRSRSVSTFSDSVGTFRRHLNVLERATPAGTRRGRAMEPYPPRAYRPGPIRGQRIDVQPMDGRQPARIGQPLPGPAGYRRAPANSRTAAAAYRRRQAQRRRRDVFFALLAGAIGSFLIAIVGLAVLWPVQILFDVLFVTYCALLIRMRNLAAERELKLRFMPAASSAPGDPLPARRPRPAYDLAAGYGDLELRRAIN